MLRIFTFLQEIKILNSLLGFQGHALQSEDQKQYVKWSVPFRQEHFEIYGRVSNPPAVLPLLWQPGATLLAQS